MAEKTQSPHPLAQGNRHSQSDEESATAHSKELKKKRE